MMDHSKHSSPRRALRTVEAARYLGLSASLLRKWRMRAPEDPGERGPPFIRLSPTVVVYEISALDRWLDERAAQHALARTGAASERHCEARQ
jgi:predicted DNA-binding transcriptional regulator AlpA